MPHKAHWTGSLLLTLTLGLSLTGCASDSEEPGVATASDATQHSPESGQDFSEEIPDFPDPVATINGEDITAEQFTNAYAQAYAQATQTNPAATSEQVQLNTLDQMIGNMLLIQEARERDLIGDDAAVDAYLDQLAEDYGLESAQEYIDRQTESGTFTEEDVRTQAASQIGVDALIDSLEYDIPTQDQLKQIYDLQAQHLRSNTTEGSSSDSIPPFDEIEDSLRSQVEATNQETSVEQLVQELMQQADIEIFLETAQTGSVPEPTPESAESS